MKCLSTGTRLSLACGAFEIYERLSYRKALASDLSALADTLGANETASLSFSDHQSARDILANSERDVDALGYAGDRGGRRRRGTGRAGEGKGGR